MAVSHQTMANKKDAGGLQCRLPAAFVADQMRLYIEPCSNFTVSQALVLGDIRVIGSKELVFAVQEWPIIAIDIRTIRAFKTPHVNIVGPCETRMRVLVKFWIAEPGHGPAFVSKLYNIPVSGPTGRDGAAVLVQLEQHWHVIRGPSVDINSRWRHLPDAVPHYITQVCVVAEFHQKPIGAAASLLI
jgi:hypothetical protein